MEVHSDEAEHHGYASGQVPDSAQGSGWRIFFIVSGTLCGLPVFILSTQIFGSLGFVQGLKAILLGGAIAGVLAAFSAFTGSRARCGLAVLADRAFGPLGARLVKLVIAISLVGWFGVNIGVVGVTVASALAQVSGWQVPALVIGLPVSVGIAAVTLFGAVGLERLGNLLVPLTGGILLLSVFLAAPHLQQVWAAKGTGTLDFASCVSAVVGTSIVGVVIQPDYGRFVRRPYQAALGAGLSLGLIYPLIMAMCALATLALGAPDLISAMIMLGFGLPALAVLLMGAWIDTCAAMYSASLSLANQLPRVSFQAIVGCIWFLGVSLVLLGVATVFIPFLMTLGLALPPLATILILSHFLNPVRADARSAALAAICWFIGSLVGFATTNHAFAMSGLPVLDSIATTAAAFVLIHLSLARARPTSLESEIP